VANVSEKAAKVAGRAKRARSGFKGERGIFRRLKDEHEEVASLMKRVVATDDATEKREWFDKVRTALLSHSKAEEKEFYPLLLAHASTRELIEHSIDEHEQVAQLIEELDIRDVAEPDWDESFDELMQSVDDHVEDEENDLFPRAKQVLSNEDVDAIEERFLRTKEAELQRLA
jgi:hemerythrin-like domain-containing protein